ncbi:hypothetical protein GGH95_004997 [Coemansia sp. RSA 1836]|nr:hypothetical protein GGH95_004997 [Coemansia sp. RSA 1836]
MAYAGARFADSLIRAIKGEVVVEPTFIALAADSQGAEQYRQIGAGDLEFFAVPVELGPQGVARIAPLNGDISSDERQAIAVAAEALATNISTGVEFVNTPPQ